MILNKLGWRVLNSIQTKTFQFEGETVFGSLNEELKAYRKDL